MFLALAVAVVLLWLSFRKQLKKIDFEEEPDEPRSKPGTDNGRATGRATGPGEPRRCRRPERSTRAGGLPESTICLARC